MFLSTLQRIDTSLDRYLSTRLNGVRADLRTFRDEVFRQLYYGKYFTGLTPLDNVELQIDEIFMDHSDRYQWILTLDEGVFVAWVGYAWQDCKMSKWTVADYVYDDFYKIIKSITFKINDTEKVLFSLQKRALPEDEFNVQLNVREVSASSAVALAKIFGAAAGPCVSISPTADTWTMHTPSGRDFVARISALRHDLATEWKIDRCGVDPNGDVNLIRFWVNDVDIMQFISLK